MLNCVWDVLFWLLSLSVAQSTFVVVSRKMAPAKSRRVVTFAILCVLPVVFAQDYSIPDVTIEALKPRGVKISIPDNPPMSLFAFQGNINRAIEENGVGTISGEANKPKNGFWTVLDEEAELKVGDVVHYYVHVVRNRKGFHKDKLSYVVKELVDVNGPPAPAPAPVPTTGGGSNPPPPNCRPSPTMVQKGSVCSGQVIFEDDFDFLNEELWNIEEYIPAAPEYPFVYYQRSSSDGLTVSVENGHLRIEPRLQRLSTEPDGEDIQYNVPLNLPRCTRQGLCSIDGIDPSIASGRVTSRFQFKYGVIEVKAKLPQGDWLYPDILLESFLNKYGPHYASGVLRIAGALGNAQLTKGTQELGNNILYGGAIMDFKCRRKLLLNKPAQAPWGNDFHVYSLRWGPDRIILSVDGEEWGRIEPAATGLHARLPQGECNPPRASLRAPMAPFDDFLRISLGVAAGGISEFPDLAVTENSNPKPWTDGQSKARLNFFRDKASWLPTWSQPALLVDYVKVRAL